MIWVYWQREIVATSWIGKFPIGVHEYGSHFDPLGYKTFRNIWAFLRKGTLKLKWWGFTPLKLVKGIRTESLIGRGKGGMHMIPCINKSSILPIEGLCSNFSCICNPLMPLETMCTYPVPRNHGLRSCYSAQIVLCRVEIWQANRHVIGHIWREL